MRDLFRLIALALISCAVVGAAMVYSREGDMATGMRAAASSVGQQISGIGQQIAGSATDALAGPSEPTGYPITIGRAHAAQWVGLAGFPDQTELTFPIPAGGRYLSGALLLGLDTQLTDAGDGLLTILVNGTPRQQLVLNGGHDSQQVRIALTSAELAQDHIVLGLAGRGTTSAGQLCPADDVNSGSAVTLSADSRLELIAEQPLSDAIGALIAAPAPLVLDPGRSTSEAAMVVWAHQQLTRNGIDARIGVAGPDETPVALLDHAASAAGMASRNQLIGQQAIAQLVTAAGTTMARPLAWPVTVADLGAETSVRSFRGSRRWTIAFAAADLPGGHLPDQFKLGLKTTPLEGTNDWVVRVTLNGNLLESRRIAGNADQIEFAVDLPAARLLPANSLIVELVDTSSAEGVCNRVADAQAQLLPESVLTDRTPAPAGWAALVEQLALLPDIAISSSLSMTAAQGTEASALLGMILPAAAKVRFDGTGAATLHVVDRAGLAAMLADQEPGQSLVAILPGAGIAPPDVVAVPSPELGAALARLEADDVFVTIAGL